MFGTDLRDVLVGHGYEVTGVGTAACDQGSGHGVIFREWFGASFELEGAVPG
jgi:hypothetical protein